MHARKALWLLVVVLGFGLAGCSDDDDDNPVTPAPTQLEQVMGVLHADLSTAPTPITTAQVLFDNLNDGDTTNDPYIISVRSATDYAKGHVPGAVNIPWRDIADAGNFARSPAFLTIPTDEDIVVYCYTGHTGGVATTVLRALGFDAKNMKFGMGSWTRVDSVRVATAFRDSVGLDVMGYATVTTVPTAGTYALPDLNVTTSSDVQEIVRAAAAAYLDGGDAPTKTAADVFANMNDGDDTNDYFIVSVRGATHYALGHVEGAINIPWAEIAQTANLQQIPPDATVVVYCYTGHTGAIATTALRMMGYEAYNMKFGMCAWTDDPTIRGTTPFQDATDSHDFAYNTGTTP
jgi:rhodanese-related sulfurtransferase